MAPNPYPGNTVAPFSPMQEQYLTGIENVAMNGDANGNAGGNYVQNVLNGQYAASTANPYLNATFQNAANAVQNQLGSEFAGSGRNPEASIAAQSDQMNQLANQIYGGQYQNSMNQMTQAAALAPQFNAIDLQNLANLGTAGSYVQAQSQDMINANQALYNAYAQQPETALSNYMNQVNSLAHGSSAANTTPVYGNSSAMNALGGAATGAAVGSEVMPGWGTAVGAGIGLLAGLI